MIRVKLITKGFIGVFICLTLMFHSCRKNNSFEGVITYENEVISKVDSLSAEEILGEVSTKDILFIKDGFYKLISNSDFLHFMLWRSIDESVYFYHLSDSMVLWHSKTNKISEFQPNFKLKKNVDTILEYPCDELSFIAENGRITKYYFSSQFALEPKFYKNYTHLFKYDIMKLMKSVYLGLTIENDQIISKTRAIKIENIKLEDDIFKVPTNKKIKRSK